MRLLLDENLPKRLKADFPEHDVCTVRDKGWNGVKNWELLKFMLAEGADTLLTFDKNLQHQPNFGEYTLTVYVLSALINQYSVLMALSAQVRQQLGSPGLPVGPVVLQEPKRRIARCGPYHLQCTTHRLAPRLPPQLLRPLAIGPAL
ncbi:DUF5615 family PIN-like protein [Hymenobacter sp. BT18]|uniref:DUF5615 family PIN-like protein n=1 Tax=Hymenobacter sp. BT18 TaxID=2835648 RepID=UPI00143EE33F|nr:DUF5615 family PIN-like protein [Hymenobacter sp. BT18]QIX60136.1 DUF5615 family PIN-like protein [Hymenobacter sp. BT18]